MTHCQPRHLFLLPCLCAVSFFFLILPLSLPIFFLPLLYALFFFLLFLPLSLPPPVALVLGCLELRISSGLGDLKCGVPHFFPLCFSYHCCTYMEDIAVHKFLLLSELLCCMSSIFVHYVLDSGMIWFCQACIFFYLRLVFNMSRPWVWYISTSSLICPRCMFDMSKTCFWYGSG